jgi:PAS domain S-box-containing protein
MALRVSGAEPRPVAAAEAAQPAELLRALADRETRLRLLLDQMPAILWTTDRDLVFTSIAGAGLRPFDTVPNSLLGIHVLQSIEGSPTRAAAYDAHLKALAGQRVHYSFQWVDHTYQCMTEPLRDAAGDIIGVIGLSFDNTEQVRAEEARRQSEARLRLLVAQMPAVLWSVDKQLRFTQLMGAGLASLGLKPNGLVGQDLYEFFGTQDRSFSAIAAHLKALEGEPVNYEIVWQERTYLAHVEPLQDAHGATVGVIGAALDITERKRAETAIREQEQRLRLIVSQIPAVLWTTDVELRFTSSQGSGLAGLGLHADELVGKLLQEYFGSNDPLLLPAMAHRKALAGESAEYEFEWRGRVYQSLVEPLRDEGNAITGVIGVSIDVTEHRETENSLQRQLSAERRRARSLRTLHNLSVRLASAASLQLLLDDAAVGLRREFAIFGAAIYLVDEERRALNLRAADGLAVPATEQVVPCGEGLVGRAAMEGEWVSALADVDAPAQATTSLRTLVVALPLRQGEERLGALKLVMDAEEPFDRLDAALMRLFADRLAGAIQRAQLFDQIRGHREQLQQLSSQLVEVQEAERRHLARELHDEIGQSLTALQFQTEMAARSADPIVKEHLAEIRATVQDLMQRVRSMTLDLRPSMLDDLGLVPALLSLIHRYVKRTGIDVDFQHGGIEVRFPASVETAAYRIVQESLTNVARHAGVKRVLARLWATPESLLLQIQDWGIGFDPDAPAAAASSGLQGIVERARLVDGRVKIESIPGVGTCLMAELPLARRE